MEQLRALEHRLNLADTELLLASGLALEAAGKMDEVPVERLSEEDQSTYHRLRALHNVLGAERRYVHEKLTEVRALVQAHASYRRDRVEYNPDEEEAT